MKTVLRSALAFLTTMVWVVGAQATDELLLKLSPSKATPEHAARLVEGWGKVLAREAPGTFRIVLNGRVPMDSALDRLVGRTGVVSARRTWRAGIATPSDDVDALAEMIAEMKLSAREKALDPEESGVDYFEAYHDYLWQRAYPNKTVDWAAYKEAERHRAAMPQVRASSGTDAVVGWSFMGPTNLDIPYKTYYGTRPINGRVNALAWDPVDPNTYYLASAGGGVWKTTSAGVNWVALSDDWPSLHTSSVAVSPVDPNTVYVGTGDYNGGGGRTLGLMKSVDGGSTWTALGVSDFGTHAISSIVIDPETPSRLILSTGRGPGGSNSFVYRSNDGGQTWSTPFGTSAQWCEVEMGARNPANGVRYTYAVGSGTGGNVWRSADRGQSWSQLAPPIGTGNHTRLNVATSPLFPDTVYLLVPADRKILKSTDAGSTWTDITAGFINGSGSNPNYNWSQSTYDAFIGCSSRDGTTDVLYVGLIDVDQSTDGGATWRSVGGPTWVSSALVHNDHHAVAVSPHDPNHVLVGSDGGAYRLSYTPSSGAYSWAFLSKNLGITQFYKSSHHPTNPDIAIGGTQDNATPVASGDLLNWRNKGGGDGGFCSINPSNPNIQYCTSQYLNVYRTVNNWNSSNGISPSIGSDTRLFIAPIRLNAADPNYLYAGTNYLYRWTESAQSWTSRLGGQALSATGSLRSIASSATDANRIYTGATDGQVWMSENGGTTWTQINTGVTSLPNRQITYINVHPSNPDDLLVTVSGTGVGHLWRCTNPRAGAARTWTDVGGTGQAGLPNVQANAVARDLDAPATTWFVGNDLGVFLTTDGGATWADATQGLGLPNVLVNDIHATPGTRMLNVATYGRGMWRLSLPPDTASLQTLVLEPSNLLGGSASTGTVELSAGAAVSGSSVALSSPSPLVAVPPSVTVPFANTSASFGISTLPVGVVTQVALTASRLGTDRQAILTLNPSPSTVVPTSVNVQPGRLAAGELSDLFNADGRHLVAQLNLAAEEAGFPVTVNLTGISPTPSPTSLSFTLESYVELSGFRQTIQLWDWQAGAFVTIDARAAPTSQAAVTAPAAGNLARFVQAGTRNLRARVGYEPVSAEVSSAWRAWIDRTWWNIQ